MQTAEFVTQTCWLQKIKERIEIVMTVKPMSAFKSALNRWARLQKGETDSTDRQVGIECCVCVT